MANTTGVPKGFRTMTPSLTVHDGKAAIEFYKKAFDAELIMIMPGPDNTGVAHAEVKIGDSILFLNDEFPQGSTKSPQTLGGTAAGIVLYVPDCDAWFARAVSAGAKATMPPTDMFWGDRMSQVIDPFGHVWGISTNKEELTPTELAERSAAFWKSHGAGQK